MLSEISKIAIDAGKAILEIYNKDYNIQQKTENGHTSPLTEADLKANEIITKRLRQLTDYPILTEEEKDNKDRVNHELVWIVDPLDGTKEFIKRNGEFTVNIALVKNKQPILAVIYAPVKDDIYTAEVNKGAYKNTQKITCSEINQISNMTLAVSRSHSNENTISKNFKDTIISGSSIKGCLIAEAKADAYIRTGPINEWDICAMSLIITESGGTITYLDGKPLNFNNEVTLIKGFAASNNTIHKEILKLTK